MEPKLMLFDDHVGLDPEMTRRVLDVCSIWPPTDDMVVVTHEMGSPCRAASGYRSWTAVGSWDVSPPRASSKRRRPAGPQRLFAQILAH